MMKRRGFDAVGGLALRRGACSPARRCAQQITIAIATGGTGGVYYPLGGGMANVLSKYVPGVAGDRARHRRLGRQSQADRLASRARSRW